MADLLWAKKHFETYGPRYERYERYYTGDQPLAFVSRKMRSSRYWCIDCRRSCRK